MPREKEGEASVFPARFAHTYTDASMIVIYTVHTAQCQDIENKYSSNTFSAIDVSDLPFAVLLVRS